MLVQACIGIVLPVLSVATISRKVLTRNSFHNIVIVYSVCLVARSSVFYIGIVFDVHFIVYRDKFLIIKPTKCANFSNLFLEGNSTCFGQFFCSS